MRCVQQHTVQREIATGRPVRGPLGLQNLPPTRRERPVVRRQALVRPDQSRPPRRPTARRWRAESPEQGPWRPSRAPSGDRRAAAGARPWSPPRARVERGECRGRGRDRPARTRPPRSAPEPRARRRRATAAQVHHLDTRSARTTVDHRTRSAGATPARRPASPHCPEPPGIPPIQPPCQPPTRRFTRSDGTVPITSNRNLVSGADTLLM